MKTEVTKEITLTVDELKKILINHLNMKNIISLEKYDMKALTIDVLNKRVKEFPPDNATYSWDSETDIIWKNVFDGLTITVKETLDD